jgi:3-deoxy-D-arabino-heptulosonate 7-phosphate (DAHP) synthase
MTPADRADGHGFALTVAAAALAVGAALLARTVHSQPS